MARRKAEPQSVQRPTEGQMRRYLDLGEAIADLRSQANDLAAEAREIPKSLGFLPTSISIYNRFSKLQKEDAEQVFEELCLLLDADPEFDRGTAQPDLFADQAVKETKRRNSKTPDEALDGSSALN